VKLRFTSISIILYAVGRTPWTGDQPCRKAATYIQTENKRKQTSMPRVGFEPTTPLFEREQRVHALDRVTTTGKRM
jgi:hypothetical protein